jgi:hypothetical protein
MRSGASGAECLDASFAVSAMRAHECLLYSALSIIASSVNVLRRTRRKPSTIRGAAPDVVIGQSTAARAGAHPYRAGEVARSCHYYSVYQRFTSNRNKGLRVGSFLVRTFLGQEWSAKIHVDVNASLQSVKALEPEVLSAIERGA